MIATNRTWMRGAGKACTTGDCNRRGNADYDSKEIMQNCSLTHQTLNYKSMEIVVCPYGRLYQQEVALEALLRRMESSVDELPHVRNRKDLFPARFSLSSSDDAGDGKVIACPVTGKELNGSLPAILIHPGKPDKPNVLSKAALSTLSKEELEEEYGSLGDKTTMIALAPTGEALEKIREEWKVVLEEAKRKKKHKKDKKHKKTKNNNKRKHSGDEAEEKKEETTSSSNKKPATASTNNNNNNNSSALDSLFTKKKKISTKEQKDSLFARGF